MKITSIQRNKLIGVAVATAGVIALIFYFLIGAQRDKLNEINGHFEGYITKQHHMKTAMAGSEKMDAELKALEDKLAADEEQMASGDLYSWMYNTIKNFKSAYRVDIPQFSTVESSPTTLLYNFPYKQVKISVSGSAFFQDLGKFLADFENHFPHMRVENLTLEPASGAEREADREKLGFRMDIVALVNANSQADKK